MTAAISIPGWPIGVAADGVLMAWRVLTGTFFPDGGATGVFCAAGILLALGFCRRCERRFFRDWARDGFFVFGLMLGLGSFVQFELRSEDFSQVSIACAWVCGLGLAQALQTTAMARR
jgi:hypothetical protein